MTASSIAIIDYGVGNHRSVFNALTRLGFSAHVTSERDVLAAATHLILPGVGSFNQGMEGLNERGLSEVLTQEVMLKKKPILGICLGMQLLAAEGFEHGHYKGLGFIPGKVIRIETGTTGLRLPHIGWNDVRVTGEHAITQGFDHVPIFYFVHSYHMVPDDPGIIAGVCEYGAPFAALVENGNIYGAQFHPEKSHEDGMRVLTNFLNV